MCLNGIIPLYIHKKRLTFVTKSKRIIAPPSRKTLVKLRISSQKLRIETGRYDHIAPDERLCSLCNCIRIEDETHFFHLHHLALI